MAISMWEARNFHMDFSLASPAISANVRISPDMLSEFDFQYAIENTQVLYEPDRRIDTFGTTQFEFNMVSELMDKVNMTRIRSGKIEAQKPLILKPDGFDNWDFENFSEEGQAFGAWLKQNMKNLALLRYGFHLKRTEISEEVVHEPIEAVSNRLVEETRASGNPMRAIIHGVDDTWEISLMKFTVEMIEKSHNINIFDFKRRGLLG
jgi:hypothetical protein